MSHPEVTVPEPVVDPRSLLMYRVYRVIYTAQLETIHIVGQVVKYERIRNKLWFSFRVFDRKKPYECMIDTDTLKKGKITRVDDYECSCMVEGA